MVQRCAGGQGVMAHASDVTRWFLPSAARARPPEGAGERETNTGRPELGRRPPLPIAATGLAFGRRPTSEEVDGGHGDPEIPAQQKFDGGGGNRTRVRSRTG